MPPFSSGFSCRADTSSMPRRSFYWLPTPFDTHVNGVQALAGGNEERLAVQSSKAYVGGHFHWDLDLVDPPACAVDGQGGKGAHPEPRQLIRTIAVRTPRARACSC
jgi:hypothetical protein